MGKKKDTTYILFMAICISFLGWICENISMVITDHYIDSRYYVLPFIPSYGLIIYIWYFFYKKYPNLIYYKDLPLKKRITYNLILYFVFCVLTFVLELTYGNLNEHLFGVTLWSYERLPLHITKYANVFISLFFGFEGLFLVKWLLPKSLNLLRRIKNIKWIKTFNIIVGSLIALDIVIFNINLCIFRKTVIYWKYPH